MSVSSAAPPIHFAAWIWRHAVARPGWPAIVTPRVKLTYTELHLAALSTAHRLKECGVEPGQTIAICARSHALNCVLLIALNRLGAVSITLSEPRDGHEVHVPEGVHVDRFVVETPFAGIMPENAVVADLEWLTPKERGISNKGLEGFRDENDIVIIFTTSGTTGTVKAVAFSSKQLETRVLRPATGVQGEWRSAPTFSRFGIGSSPGFRVALETLWAGGTLYTGWQGTTLSTVVSRNRIARFFGSPAHFQEVFREVEVKPSDFASVRYAVVAGSAMPRPLIRTIRARLCSMIVNRYGSTETGLLAFGPLTENDPSGDCGVLVPWKEGQVVDENGKVLPAGTEGVLRFRCEEMISGYLNDAKATAECFRDGWFYPGDTGTISEERRLTVTGRTTERINAGGVKVSPQAVEEVVGAFEGVADCAAFGFSAGLGVQQIWAAVVTDGGCDLEKLRKHCASKLGVRAPRRFLKLAQLPRNESGKILRSALTELAAAEAKARKAPAPASP